MNRAYKVEEVEMLAQAVLVKAGLPAPVAGSVAGGLIAADLYSHSTHGLALLGKYVDEIEGGRMERNGSPEVLTDLGAVTLWNARRLPGIWTTSLAVDEACRRSNTFGCGVVVLKNSHHIACLAGFLETSARQGKIVLVMSSDPASAHVAPFGGTTPVMTPNPIAAGIPTSGDPILVDISTSITTAARCDRARANGTGLPGKWMINADGEATDDPDAIKAGGALLPVGGLDHGHKGYGLGLIVESLTQGLAGFGRADSPSGWGASVTVLAFDPAAFGGQAGFERQSDFLVSLCRSAKVPREAAPVRLPGEAALARKREADAHGLRLGDGITSSLHQLSSRFGVPMPAPI